MDFTYVDCGTWANAMKMLEDHEIDTNAIINIVKLAQDDYIGNGVGNVLEDLRQIETVSDYLVSLLNNVLDMSSIEQGEASTSS